MQVITNLQASDTSLLNLISINFTKHLTISIYY